MTHSQLSLLVATLLATATATAAPSASSAQAATIAPYADYITYVTTLQSRTGGDHVLAIGTADPSGARCFAAARTRTERDVCGQYLAEKALVEATHTIAVAIRAKQILDATPDEPSRAELLPFGHACIAAADRLAEAGVPPLRKIGPYTVGLLRSKLCNALVAATSAFVADDDAVPPTEH